MNTGRFLRVGIAVTMMLATSAWTQYQDQGQDQGQGQGQESSPGGGQPAGGGQPVDVARISMIHGDVSVQRGDSGDTASATLNNPMVRGDQLATGDKSRAELELDYANILRLSSNSQAKIAELSRTRIQIQVSQGYANYSLFKGGEAEVEIDTPNVAVHPLSHGRYLVQVNSDMETDVIVRDGEAEVTTPQGSTRVKDGQMILIRGVDNPEYKVADAPERTDWDRWNQDRDNLIKNANAWRKTNSYYTGAHDLDAYGRWVNVPGYGDVWQPDQGPAWAPYQVGRWVWEPYWGWTWVSYEPWGWAPYHYGRWFVWGGSWVWWPGPIYQPYYRPVWSPAFVVFVGFGHGFGGGFGFGSIGWFPCGPHDFFYPWYGRGFRNVNVVNITNITVINHGGVGVVGPLAGHGVREFSNARLVLTDGRVRGSVTSVSAQDFGHGVTSSRRFGVDAGEMRQGRMVAGNLGVVPTRESLHAGGAAQGGIPAHGNDHFFTRNTPRAGLPSFHDQAADVGRVVQAHGGNTGSEIGGRGEFNRGQENGNGSRMSQGGTQIAQSGGNKDIKPQGGPDRTTGSNDSQHGSSNGWRSFGGANGRGQNNNGAQGPTSEEMTRGRGVSDSGMGPRMSQGGQSGNPSGKNGGNGSGNGNSGQNGDRGGWTKFGGRSDGSPQGGGQQNDYGRGSRNDNAGQYSSRGTNNGDRYDRPSYKPPLEMNKPVVTPRDSRNNSAPSYTQDSRRNSYSPPSRSEIYSAPTHSSGGGYGGYSRGSGGSSGGSSRGSSGGSSHGSGSSGGSRSSGGSHSSSSSNNSGSGKHR